MPHNQRRSKNEQRQPPATPKHKSDLGVLRFKADGSQVTIQLNSAASAFDADGSSVHATVHTLRVDLKTSKVWVGQAPPLPNSSSSALGIIGLLRLERGAILALVTEATRVCGLLDGPMYKVKNTALVAPEAINSCPNDLRYAALLQNALDPKNFGSHMYFSHTANITLSRQRLADSEPGVPDLPGSWHHSPTNERSSGGATPNTAHPAPQASLGPWWQANSAQAVADDDDPCKADVSAQEDRTAATTSSAGSFGSSAASAAAAGRQAGRDLSKRAGAGGGQTLWARADPRFLWNRELMRPLIDAGAEIFAMPIMVGYAGVVTGLSSRLCGAACARPPGGGVDRPDATAASGGAAAERQGPGELTLITRLGVERPVAGGWRRGADSQGNTAGFAETEVLLTVWQPDDENPVPPAGSEANDDGNLHRQARVAIASYVMLRGSAPLFWAAPPDLQPCPAPRGPEDPSEHKLPFAKHAEALLKAYGTPLLLLNLIWGGNQGAQLRLHEALQRQAEATNSARRAPSTTKSANHARSDGLVEAVGTGLDPATSGPAGDGPRGSRDVVVVGMPLERGDFTQLATCGRAAARLEAACDPESSRIRTFIAVEQLQMAAPVAAAGAGPATQPALAPGADAAAVVGGAGGGSGDKGAGGQARSRRVTCVGRHVASRQEGVVRVSSASTGSAGGSCEEVDLAQHCLALPALAEALVAMGALKDVADLDDTHTDVMYALAQLWSHQADVLSDQMLGTSSAAGRALRAAAAGHEFRSGGLGWLVEQLARKPWRSAVGAGDMLARYYYGNFTDAQRQDALDLASGAHKVSQPPANMPRRQPPSTSSIQLGILLIILAAIQVVVCVFKPPPSLHELAMRTVGPAAIGGLLLYNVMRTGATYVEQPLLRPQEVFPWAQ